MEEMLTNYIFCLLDVIVISLVLYRTNREKMRSKYVLIVVPLFISIALFLSDYWISFSIYNIIIDYMILFLLIHLLLRGRLEEKIYYLFALFIIFSMLDIISGVIVTNIFQSTMEESVNNLMIKTIAWIIARGVYLITFPKINFYFSNLKIMNGKSKYSLIVFFLFDLIFMLFCYTLVYYYTADGSSYIIMIIISVVIFNILLNNLLQKIDDFAHQDMEWRQKEQIYQLRLKNIEQEFQYIDQFHREKHDFKQHLQMILAYLSIDKVVEAKKYIFKLTDRIDNVDQLNTSKYPEITSFILYKINNAKNKGIDIQEEIQFPDLLSIDIIDLTIILGNLFDNAIEANELNPIEKKKIILKITQSNNFLYIYTENPYSDIKVIDDKLQTTKSDKESHGIGLKNIHFIVDKYKGHVIIDTSSEIFSIKIALKNLVEQDSPVTA